MPSRKDYRKMKLEERCDNLNLNLNLDCGYEGDTLVTDRARLSTNNSLGGEFIRSLSDSRPFVPVSSVTA